MPVQLAKPRDKCPFSGEELHIVALSDGSVGDSRYQVRGEGWVSTRLFPSIETAQWWASHNLGREPKFQNPYKRVSIGRDADDPYTPDDEKALEEEVQSDHKIVASFAEQAVDEGIL